MDSIRIEINKADPIRLIASGAPEDEYESEIKEISQGIKFCRNAVELQELIYKVFVKMFGPDIAGSRKTYKAISENITESSDLLN